MILNEKEAVVPLKDDKSNLLSYFSKKIYENISKDEIPLRFVVTKTDDKNYHCELGILSELNDFHFPPNKSIFNFKKRKYENTDAFTAVLLIPTGIGAEIGGHSGDGGPVARLIASSCDTLITHPNVVNAADINELPENGLYVEGSIISRLLMGTISLQKVRSNRVILLVDKHHEKLFHELAINSASAARAALGLDCPKVLSMDKKILMRALYSGSGRAVGRIEFIENVIEMLNEHKEEYDAVALSTIINVPDHYHAEDFHFLSYHLY